MVVILDQEFPPNSNLSYETLISEHNYFFHPVDPEKWTKKPPNYIAFFLKGELLSIHHIESYEVFNDPNDVIGEIDSQIWETHFLYSLGKAILPQSKIELGNTEHHIIWCMIDTLLTSDTIEEAVSQTKEREQSAKYED